MREHRSVRSTARQESIDRIGSVDDSDVEHAEDASTGGTRRLACHPPLGLALLLATGEPARHAVRTPHGSAEALLAQRSVDAVLVAVHTHLLQLAVRSPLHAADARLQLLQKSRCKHFTLREYSANDSTVHSPGRAAS